MTRLSTINEHENGGLKIIDLESMIKSLRPAWLKRIFQCNNGAWRSFLRFSLEKWRVKDLSPRPSPPPHFRLRRPWHWLPQRASNFLRHIFHLTLQRRNGNATGHFFLLNTGMNFVTTLKSGKEVNDLLFELDATNSYTMQNGFNTRRLESKGTFS